MTQWPSQSKAVVVLPSRPLTTQRSRLICIYKVSCYSLALLFILGLSVQLSSLGTSLRLFGPTNLYLYGLNGLMFFLFVKVKWSIDEFRMQQQLFGTASFHRQHFVFIRKTLDSLFPYLFLWWLNPLEVAVYPPANVTLRETAEQEEQTPASQTTQHAPIAVEADSTMVRIGISLFGKVTLSLIGANGKKLAFSFQKQQGRHRYAALIAYLAVNGCALREKILSDLYRMMADSASSFDRDRRRITQLINDMASSHGFMPVVLFEHRKDASKQVMWRLSSLCVVEDEASRLLDTWYDRIREAQTNRLVLSLEDLREGYRQIIQSCAEGYLGQYIGEQNLWHWARPMFFASRSKYLTILEYAAQRERDEGLHAPARRQACLAQAAQLYEQCALKAIDAIPDTQRGERNLRRCLDMYEHDLHDSDAAKQIRTRYEKMRKDHVSQA